MLTDNTPPASSRYTRFFDEKLALKVSMTGQLALLALIEKLAAEGIKIEPTINPKTFHRK